MRPSRALFSSSVKVMFALSLLLLAGIPLWSQAGQEAQASS
jgi:hypothetical protein